MLPLINISKADYLPRKYKPERNVKINKAS